MHSSFADYPSYENFKISEIQLYDNITWQISKGHALHRELLFFPDKFTHLFLFKHSKWPGITVLPHSK